MSTLTLNSFHSVFLHETTLPSIGQFQNLDNSCFMLTERSVPLECNFNVTPPQKKNIEQQYM